MKGWWAPRAPGKAERGRWSVWVNGNWRITFEFRDGQAYAKLRVSPSTLNRILTGVSSISPEMALRLSKCLGRSAESWLAMQHSYDLWQAKRHVDLRGVETLEVRV